ncbi:MAG: DUF4384 domain-containing protein [Cytophagales bacterium]|nr:MAG: DUF4384 domain-containing protein [Cytophagales bacterium]
MRNKSILLFVWIFLLAFSLTQNSYAQQKYPLGMNFDDASYQQVNKKATLITRDYQVLPKAASLKNFCPIPKNQGQYGTCVGWSTAYAARTILEAKQNNWTDKTTITSNAFAAGFIYKQIKDANDASCRYGSFIDDALSTMMEKGAAKYSLFSESCPDEIPSNVFQAASGYKIQDFARLFEQDDNKSSKIQTTKKALANGNPVVIGMKCPDSFQNASGYWQPSQDEDPSYQYGGHAMCVIGYDNDMYGGAFEIQNSWGTDWGNEGYIWIRYDDFADFVKYGYEVIAINKGSNVAAVDLSGEIKFVNANGSEMNATLQTNQQGVGYYAMTQAYSSGTRFRLYISNNQPAYVYAIGSDLTTKIFNIFPHKAGISAALNYSSNSVAIPDEDHYVQMDNTIGTDYLCVLYSKEPLNIDQIKQLISQQTGSFAEKITKALSTKLVSSDKASFEQGGVRFQAASGDKSVIAVIVETKHI